MKRRLIATIIGGIILGIFVSGFAFAGDEFGVLSESYVYPEGLRLDKDSVIQWWNNIYMEIDYNDKREADFSNKALIPARTWFGFGVIWDPDGPDGRGFWNAQGKDMSAYANGSIKFWVKTETPLKIGIQDDVGSGPVWVELGNPPYNMPSDNQWRFISLPIATHFSSVDLSELAQLFMVANSDSQLPSSFGLTFHVDNVRYDTEVTSALDNIGVYPASLTIPINMPKAFKASGYDADGDTVDIYPDWSNPGNKGTFNATTGGIVIFTPNQAINSGKIRADYAGERGEASINATDITFNDFFNLLIDDGLYGGLGIIDSDLDADEDGEDDDGDGINNSSVTLSTVTDEHPTNYTESLKASYSIVKNGWAGIFIQEGNADPGKGTVDETSVKDLSRFNDAYLNFWVKKPAGVDLIIGMRSNNIPKTYEISKIKLSEYGIALDNGWHEVNIAVDDFKIRDSRLDLSNQKVFFAATVTGEQIGAPSDPDDTVYTGDLYFSNVRYARRKETPAALSVAIKKRSDNQVDPAGKIGWLNAETNSDWKIADHYLEIAYDTLHPSWGAQVYTDNMGTNASPQYTGDPDKYIDQQPAGIMAVGAPFLTCPVAWMVLDELNTNIPVPKEKDNGEPVNTPEYKIFFESDTGGMWGAEEAKGEWSWLKDKRSTVWLNDNINPNVVDESEIGADFSQTGDEYSTFISTTGIGTGWRDPVTDERIYILNPESPIYLYIAANFERAREAREYKTNTITLELFHD